MKRSTILLSISFLLAASLSGCKKIEFPDLAPCSVAGKMLAGATCSTTNSHQRSRINLAQLIEMLEPQPEREVPDPKDPTKKIKLPKRAAAVILPAESWAKQRIFNEQACEKMGQNICTPEMREQLNQINATVQSVQDESAKLKGIK